MGCDLKLSASIAWHADLWEGSLGSKEPQDGCGLVTFWGKLVKITPPGGVAGGSSWGEEERGGEGGCSWVCQREVHEGRGKGEARGGREEGGRGRRGRGRLMRGGGEGRCGGGEGGRRRGGSCGRGGGGKKKGRLVWQGGRGEEEGEARVAGG